MHLTNLVNLLLFCWESQAGSIWLFSHILYIYLFLVFRVLKPLYLFFKFVSPLHENKECLRLLKDSYQHVYLWGKHLANVTHLGKPSCHLPHSLFGSWSIIFLFYWIHSEALWKHLFVIIWIVWRSATVFANLWGRILIYSVFCVLVPFNNNIHT